MQRSVDSGTPTAEGNPRSPLHNVIEVTPDLVSGSEPEGVRGFAALRARGIKTVVSVDGATPDLENARAHGLRYVHLPIGYHGIERTRRLELARAIRDLPKPVYLHCHHGRHRGPAAAASAAVMLGRLTNDEALDFMRRAGTSQQYTGLFATVRKVRPVEAAELAQVPLDFPEVAPVPGFVKGMAEIQVAYDHLIEIRDAGWQTPAHHPDLVPSAEAGKLENLLRALWQDEAVTQYPADFAKQMRSAWAAAQAFERALGDRAAPVELARRLRVVGDTCKRCHAAYRNTR